MLDAIEEKLIRLALDKGAQPGEIDNAACMLIKKLRKRGVRADDLIDALETKTLPAVCGTLTMPFGKYEGVELAYIPYDYLLWVLRNCRNISHHLRQAIFECIDKSA